MKAARNNPTLEVVGIGAATDASPASPHWLSLDSHEDTPGSEQRSSHTRSLPSSLGGRYGGACLGFLVRS